MAQDNLKDSTSPHPSEEACKHSRCILLSLIILAIGLFAGFVLCKVLVPASQDVIKKNYDDGYKAAMDIAKNKLAQKGIFSASANNGTNISRGIIKLINGNKITAEIDSSLLDFFAEGTVTKIITVTDTTKIEQITPKSIEQFNNEQDDFRKKINQQGNNNIEVNNDTVAMTPPSPFLTKEFTINDLKVGDLINFYGNGDLSVSDSIDASYISVTNISGQSDSIATPSKIDDKMTDNNSITADDIKNQQLQISESDFDPNTDKNIRFEENQGVIDPNPDKNIRFEENQGVIDPNPDKNKIQN